MRHLRFPWLALAFAAGVGAVALAPADVPGGHLLCLSGAGLALALAMRGPGPHARLMLALVCAGAVRMAAARLDVERASLLPAGVVADDHGLDTLVGTVAGPVEDRAQQRAFPLVMDDAAAPGAAAAGPGGPGTPLDAWPRATRPRLARVWITVRDPAAHTAAPVLPGDRVRVRGRLRTPRGYRVPGALDAQRLAALRDAPLALATRRVEVLAAGASPWRWPGRMQRWAAATLARDRDPAAAAAARAMIAGDRGGLDMAASERFRDAGVAHVLSVSGLHLAVVALLCFAAVRRAWAAVPALAVRVEPARAAALVAAPLAVGFTMTTGAQVATVRALMVVLVVLAGAATVRRARIIDALGAAALLLLCAQPWSLFDPSFQLSFAATATLALALGRSARGERPAASAGRLRHLRGLLARGLRSLRALALASLWTTLATAPFTALAFGMMATGGLIANIPVVPLTELVIVPLGLLGLALAAVWHAAGALVLDVAVAASGWVVAIADATAAVAPVLPLPPPSATELAACAVLWAAAIAGVRGWWPRRTALALAALSLVVLGAAHAHARWLGPALRDELRVTFLDVGQGDAAVLELPGGAVWMIDGGGLPFVSDDQALSPAERQRLAEAPGAQSVARFLAARRIERIDIAVISHPHPDHYEGMRAVARAVEIREVWVARPPVPAGEAPSYQALMRELEARGTRIVHPLLDAPIAQRGVVMTALAPRYLDAAASADPVLGINDNSLVVRVDYARRMMLFAGDLEREGENLLHARQGRRLRADVVKVAHHGSATSSTPRFVRATAPALAVISCGALNRFGFPAERVMARWQAQGAAVLRTDRAGAITLVIEPDGAVRVATFDALRARPGQ